MTHHQGRQPQLLDHVGDGEGFSRSGHPEEDIMFLSFPEPLQQAGNGFGLIPGGGIRGLKLEVHGEVGSCRTRTYNLLLKREQLYH